MITITDQKNLELLKAQFPNVFKLHQEGITISEQWNFCQSKMVQILSELYLSKIHLLLKCESLKHYAILFWQLPEYTAADLVTVAKKASEIPEMISLLKERKTTLSKLRKICPVITQENQKEWLDLSCECTSRIIEKTVAAFQKKEVTQESCRYTSGTEVELKIGISEETFLELEQLKDLLSQKNQKPAELREVLGYLTTLGLEKLDPVRKAHRAQKRRNKQDMEKHTTQKPTTTNQNEAAEEMIVRAVEKREKISIEANENVNEPPNIINATKITENIKARTNLQANAINANAKKDTHNHTSANPNSNARQNKHVPGRVTLRSRRSSLPASVKHQVHLRDQHQCTEILPDGHRCSSRRFLDLHHVVSVAHGGADEINNLVTLCDGHHQARHMNLEPHAGIH